MAQEAALTRPQNTVLEALRELGGEATSRQIAIATKMRVSDVSNVMKKLTTRARKIRGKGADRVWYLLREEPEGKGTSLAGARRGASAPPL